MGRLSTALDRFKRGCSTGTRTAYLRGRILDSEANAECASRSGAAESDNFPGYRRGEFI